MRSGRDLQCMLVIKVNHTVKLYANLIPNNNYTPQLSILSPVPPLPDVHSQAVGDVGVVVVGVLELQTEGAGRGVAGVKGLLGDQPHVVGARHVEVTGVVEDDLSVYLAEEGKRLVFSALEK